ncbi:MAG: hypothetical protein V4726_19010 [Verrucomicrobiota bacterium]
MSLILGLAALPPFWVAGRVKAQDSVRNQPSHAQDDPAAMDGKPSSPEESAARPEDQRRNTEGDEELPAEFQPERIIPFQQSQVELPDWRGREYSEISGGLRPANQGGGLFPLEIWPLQPAPPLAPLPPPPENPGVLTPPQGTESENRTPSGVLSPELAARYFARRPDRVLVDPQHLLDAAETGEMESRVQRWLNAECVFKTTLLVFGPGQKLPAEVDSDALMRQWFNAAPDALLVFYYYEQPERTKVMFAPGGARRFSEDQLTAAMVSAIRQAGRAEGGLAQLERFCYKTTVLLHRLARATPPSAPRPARRGSHAVRGWTWAVLGTAVLVAVLRAVQKRRQARGKVEAPPVFLPEEDFQTRLGAPHCGGFAAVLTFTVHKRGER